MNIIITISRIISLLIPVIWGVSMAAYIKRRKLENLLFTLSLTLFTVGIIACLSTGLDLFGLE